MRNLLFLLMLLSIPYSSHSQSTRTKQVVLDAKQAVRILDSLHRLPLVRKEAYFWRATADSTQRSADSLRVAATRYLEAKQAAERAERLQHTLAVSNAVKYADFKRKAHHRTVIIVALAVWNLFAGYYLVTH